MRFCLVAYSLSPVSPSWRRNFYEKLSLKPSLPPFAPSLPSENSIRLRSFPIPVILPCSSRSVNTQGPSKRRMFFLVWASKSFIPPFRKHSFWILWVDAVFWHPTPSASLQERPGSLRPSFGHPLLGGFPIQVSLTLYIYLVKVKGLGIDLVAYFLFPWSF